MNSLLWLIAVFAAAVAFVILGRVDAGYVLYVVPPYRVEVTMLFYALAALAAFFILYALLRLLGQILALPATVRAYRARRRRERAHGALAAALQAYYEGRYRRAEREAALAFEIGPVPRLAALLAARAAHQLRDVEPRDRRHPRVAGAAARHATALGKAGLAREILEKSLAAEWNSKLIGLYGELPAQLDPAERGEEARVRIERAERWLAERSRDPELLAALGRLCAQAELWGKAKSFLEASLSFEETRSAHLELARLTERLGQSGEAQRHFRRPAELP